MPDTKLADAGITVINDKAVAVDSVQKTVTLLTGSVLSYDKLLIANGAEPILPQLSGSDLNGVFTLRNIPDAEQMINFIVERNINSIAIIGAGFIGLEVGSLLKQTHPKIKVTVVEFLDVPLPTMLDTELAAKVGEYLPQQGIELLTGRRVTAIKGNDGYVTGVELDFDEVISTDMVLMSVGAKSDHQLAQQAGLEMGQFGIKVNEFMETSNPDIFAAGDNVETKCFISGNKMPSQLRGVAVCQGRLVAKRLSGAAIPFPGVLNNSCVKLFGISAACVGLSETCAANYGIETVSFTVDSRSKHGMVDGMQPWTLKVVFSKESRKVIGSQIVSMSESAVKEIDTMNMAIKMGATPEDLLTINCAGQPELSSEPSLEPISIIGVQASAKI